MNLRSEIQSRTSEFLILCQTQVDLLTYASIKNPVFKENIDRTKTLIYDSSGQKVLV